MKLTLTILLASCSIVLSNAGTFYAANNGNDSNPGTKAQPWSHLPYMQLFSGTYVHTAGDHLILKGGDTWPAQGNCLWQLPDFGTPAATPDYIGVDLTWFTGASFTQPTIDGHFANFNGTTDANHGFNDMFRPLGANLILDNIHWTGLWWNSSQTYQQVAYILENSTGNNTNFIVMNCLFDGWAHGPGSTAGVLTCVVGAQGAGFKDLGNMFTNCTFNGSTPANSTDFQSTGTGLYLYGGKVINCRFLNMCNPMIIANNGPSGWCEIAGFDIGPIWNSWTSGEHDNGLRIPQGAGTIPIHDFYMHDTSSACFFSGDSGETEIYYNGVIYNPRQSPVWFIDPLSASGGKSVVLNCTVYAAGHSIFTVPGRGNAHSYASATITNSFLIQAGTLFDTTTTPLLASSIDSTPSVPLSTANVQGYVLGNRYQPTAVGTATYGVGRDLSASVGGKLTKDILGVTRPQAQGWDAGGYEYTSSSPGTISLSTAAQSVSQNAGSVTITAVRNNGTTGAASVFLVTADGSAISGHDYTGVTNQFNWAPGATGARSVQIPISASGDTALTNRTFTAYLTNVVTAALVSPTSQVITILMNPPPVTFVQTVTSIGPAAGVTVTCAPPDINGMGTSQTAFTRTYNSGATVTLGAPAIAGANTFVKWQKDGVDWTNVISFSFTADAVHTWTAVYMAVPPSVFQLTVTSVPNGQTITMNPLDVNSAGNGITPFSRLYTSNTLVSLTAPSSGFVKWQLDGGDYAFSAATSLNLTAQHTMSAFYMPTNAGVFSLTQSSYGTCVTCGTVNIGVARAGSTNIAASVSYATSNGSAVAGTDYVAASGTLNFAENNNGLQTISISIINTGALGQPRSFTIALQNPTAGATINQALAIVSITQNGIIIVPVAVSANGQVTIQGNVTIQGK